MVIGILVTAAALCIAASGAALAGQRQFAGVASYYSKGYSGSVASGGRYDPTKLTAAHKTLPFGTRVRVTDRKTHHSVVVTITDRGPFSEGRTIDLSLAAAQKLDMIERGVIGVIAEIQPTVPTSAE